MFISKYNYFLPCLFFAPFAHQVSNNLNHFPTSLFFFYLSPSFQILNLFLPFSFSFSSNFLKTSLILILIFYHFLSLFSPYLVSLCQQVELVGLYLYLYYIILYYIIYIMSIYYIYYVYLFLCLFIFLFLSTSLILNLPPSLFFLYPFSLCISQF